MSEFGVFKINTLNIYFAVFWIFWNLLNQLCVTNIRYTLSLYSWCGKLLAKISICSKRKINKIIYQASSVWKRFRLILMLLMKLIIAFQQLEIQPKTLHSHSFNYYLYIQDSFYSLVESSIVGKTKGPSQRSIDLSRREARQQHRRVPMTRFVR